MRVRATCALDGSRPRVLALGLGFLIASFCVALEVPFLSGRVVDGAGMIPSGTASRIEAKLADLEARTGIQVAVLTVPSLQDEALEDYTIRVVDTWKLGQKDKDTGVLLFVAQQERRLRLEVGYGLESVLTDAMSRRVLDNIMTPSFKQGDFGGGIERGVDAVIAVVSGEGEPPAMRTQPKSDGLGGCGLLLILFLFFIVIPALNRASHHRRGWSSRRGWSVPWVIGSGGFGRSGGFGGGGGFSGGGGGFGGGGASGGW